MEYTQEMWDATELLIEWDCYGLKFQLLEVPGRFIDVNRGIPGLLLSGLNDANVREIEILLDDENRSEELSNLQTGEFLLEAMQKAPDSAREVLKRFFNPKAKKPHPYLDKNS